MRTTAALCALVALLSACGQEPESTQLDPASTTEAPTTTAHASTTVATTTSTSTMSTTTTATTSTAPPSTAVPTTALPTTEADRSETKMPEPTDPIDPVVLASELVQTAIADLRERLGDADAEITVVSVEEVTWNDGSIGCPQPGMVYTQALVDGSRIVLSHAGIPYRYHQAAGRAPFYCPLSVSAGDG